MSKNIFDLVIFHKNCNDGFGSALVAWTKFKNYPKYFSADHNEKPPNYIGKSVLMLDFTYSKEIMEDMEKHTKKLFIIDHHKSAINKLENINPNKYILDMNHSAAVLTWKYFYPLEKVPEFLEYIEDRDLWENKLFYTEECFLGLSLLQKSFKIWNDYLETGVDELVKDGALLLQQKNKDINFLINYSYLKNFKVGNNTYSVVYLNSPLHRSDLGNVLAKKYKDTDFAAIYNYNGSKNITYFSLRSCNNFDVSKIAELFKGGGHQAASGCSIPGCVSQLPNVSSFNV